MTTNQLQNVRGNITRVLSRLNEGITLDVEFTRLVLRDADDCLRDYEAVIRAVTNPQGAIVETERP
jgi:hypothetical protein